MAVGPGLAGAEADVLAPGAFADPDGSGVSPGDAERPPFPSLPRAGSAPPAAPPPATPPPDSALPPSGASPPRGPAECDGLARSPSPSPTLIQPAAAATATTVAARRTGTYKGRTGATSEAG
ncbi:hypothetical protein SSP24_59360 [Streptomyces spinoverrucosus]|uniref:Uncharacterized protein n=1 Tax=Streptomyces spinoverrucosus TaxID=284043 RepID=A0A4Y3VR92_9ACTN|nr:hypothetical protein [Streptomyces spinoverrucosus]GEC08281.1 hypothetical protein SSP24_59360 [Streptomyces spinoverrucosus]GHB88263.1 hypothetical protein GCM10010397_70330 [Streptomyces spinoverrucosus]